MALGYSPRKCGNLGSTAASAGTGPAACSAGWAGHEGACAAPPLAAATAPSVAAVTSPWLGVATAPLHAPPAAAPALAPSAAPALAHSPSMMLHTSSAYAVHCRHRSTASGSPDAAGCVWDSAQ